MTDMHLYYLKNKKHILEKQIQYHSTPAGAYRVLHRRAKYKKLPICSIKEFSSWYTTTEKICYYCKIPENKLRFLKVSKLFKKRFTIDKKIPSLGYTPDNMVFACNLCNMVKSNYFTEAEMLSLAKNYITPKWQKELTSSPSRNVKPSQNPPKSREYINKS